MKCSRTQECRLVLTEGRGESVTNDQPEYFTISFISPPTLDLNWQEIYNIPDQHPPPNYSILATIHIYPLRGKDQQIPCILESGRQHSTEIDTPTLIGSTQSVCRYFIICFFCSLIFNLWKLYEPKHSKCGWMKRPIKRRLPLKGSMNVALLRCLTGTVMEKLSPNLT